MPRGLPRWCRSPPSLAFQIATPRDGGVSPPQAFLLRLLPRRDRDPALVAYPTPVFVVTSELPGIPSMGLFSSSFWGTPCEIRWSFGCLQYYCTSFVDEDIQRTPACIPGSCLQLRGFDGQEREATSIL